MRAHGLSFYFVFRHGVLSSSASHKPLAKDSIALPNMCVLMGVSVAPRSLVELSFVKSHADRWMYSREDCVLWRRTMFQQPSAAFDLAFDETLP